MGSPLDDDINEKLIIYSDWIFYGINMNILRFSWPITTSTPIYNLNTLQEKADFSSQHVYMVIFEISDDAESARLCAQSVILSNS